ncbi:MAG: exodeoxyribonuclease VII small subunit [Propionibacterium sp.]|nr:exodeoxyribonuclease VII small subunit [Propionibacterium sp.]MDN6794771.1 exodeoxyribonuclease VII small subunit [Propionibacterium sp.]
MNDHAPVQDLPDPSTLGYEQARDELVDIVSRLEGGRAPLEATLELWERGEALAARCRSILEDAQARLDRTQQQAPDAQNLQA